MKKRTSKAGAASERTSFSMYPASRARVRKALAGFHCSAWIEKC